MAHPKTSLRRAKNFSSALFLVGLAIVSFTETWWPGMMLVIGIPLALRQYLFGRNYDALLSLVVFGGIFIASGFNISWEILLPVLFTVAALYILGREFFTPYPTTEPEDEESLSYEISDNEKKHHDL